MRATVEGGIAFQAWAFVGMRRGAEIGFVCEGSIELSR